MNYSFRILDPHAVAYLDLTGSGVETIAHARENGRIVFMFCAFGAAENRPAARKERGPPAGLAGIPTCSDVTISRTPGQRAIVRASVTRISDCRAACLWTSTRRSRHRSCGGRQRKDQRGAVRRKKNALASRSARTPRASDSRAPSNGAVSVDSPFLRGEALPHSAPRSPPVTPTASSRPSRARRSA